PPAQVLPVLARAASDQDESVRTAAIGFLAAAPSSDATRILIDFLASEAPHEQILAALATPVEDRVPAILAALETADDDLAPERTQGLARLARPDARAALFQAALLATPAARKAALTTLAALGTREAVSAVETASREDPDPEVRRVSLLLLAP